MKIYIENNDIYNNISDELRDTLEEYVCSGDGFEDEKAKIEIEMLLKDIAPTSENAYRAQDVKYHPGNVKKGDTFNMDLRSFTLSEKRGIGFAYGGLDIGSGDYIDNPRLIIVKGPSRKFDVSWVYYRYAYEEEVLMSGRFRVIDIYDKQFDGYDNAVNVIEVKQIG